MADDLFSVLKAFNLEGELSKQFSSPQGREEMLRIMRLPPMMERKLRESWAAEDKAKAKPPESTEPPKLTEHDYFNTCLSFGMTAEQSRIAAMVQIGKSPQEVAAFINQKCPGIFMSPRTAMVYVNNDIIPRVTHHTKQYDTDTSSQQQQQPAATGASASS